MTAKPNLVTQPDFNHGAWDVSLRYVRKTTAQQSPANSTAGVVSFSGRRTTSYYWSSATIAPSQPNKTYEANVWVKTAAQSCQIILMRVNSTGRRYIYEDARAIPADNQWHQIRWSFANDANTRGSSVGFRFGTPSTTAVISLYSPRLVEGEDTVVNEQQQGGQEEEQQQQQEEEETTTTTTTTTETASTTVAATSMEQVYTQNINAIVNIAMRATNGSYFSGSGFFISADGYIVTAAHVVTYGSAPAPYATNVHVQYYPENRVVDAQIVGVDRLYDVAVLKVALTGRTYLQFADSRQTKIGSVVAAFGQPLGQHVQSITQGVVVDNKCQDYSWMAESLIADFDIVGGNSGGPVVSLQSKCVGLVSWGLDDGAWALNGAIASHVIIPIVERIRATQSDFRASYIGVSFLPTDLYDVIAAPQRFANREVVGVVLTSVVAGSPAQAAGLVTGDIVTHCDNKPVGKNNEQEPFGTLVHLAPVGSTLSLRVLRANGSIISSVNVTTQQLPAAYDYIFSQRFNIEQLRNASEKSIIVT